MCNSGQWENCLPPWPAPLALPFCPFSMANEERGVGTNRCFSKENMMSPKPFLPARSVGGELRAYGREVRAWSTGLLMRYVVAGALLLAALAGLIGAIAIGLGALFHFLEMKYGTWIAYESIGGLLIVLTVMAAALGIAKLKQEMPAPPSAQRHAKAASRIAVAEGMGTLAVWPNLGGAACPAGRHRPC